MSDVVSLDHDAWGRLVLVDSRGERHVGVTAVQAFPVTAPGESVSLLGSGGREVAWIPRLSELPVATREVIQQELAAREFVPVVRRIVHIEGTIEPVEWTVETDRGTTRFVLKSEDDVRRLAEERVLITDADGVRYLVPNFRKLDPFSRRALERYV